MDLDSRAAVYRRRLVGVLRDRGIADPAILAGFMAVPRHRFVARFWVGGMVDGSLVDHSVVRTMDESASEEVLALAYAADVALLSAPVNEATSSLSAPALIAVMLEELDLAPGLRVLEVGAGSGYHAAMMARLVADPALVTTIDIDGDLVEGARTRLAKLGYGGITVVEGDGAAQIEGGSFDRIVATVGCADVAPPWRAQLSENGMLLVPLLHGTAHPRFKLSKVDGGLAGRIVGYSGFVGIRGVQEASSPWLGGLAGRTGIEPIRTELPEPLDVLAPDVSTGPGWLPAQSAFGFYLALRDRRVAHTCAIRDGNSYAGVLADQLLYGGEDGERLVAELITVAQDWIALGAPGLDRYQVTFQPTDLSLPGLLTTGRAHESAGPWQIQRINHLQTVTLDPK